ncbi:MAG: hypothetical protein P4M04_01505 [Acidobacteriota bacterium]|nr:hypothetical protein [Acidobacteriota bacterium]
MLKAILKALLRLVAMAVWTAAGFCMGFLLGGKICEWWVVPGWVKQYPHDGQLGLGVLGYAVGGGLLGGIAALASGIFLILRLPRFEKFFR